MAQHESYLHVNQNDINMTIKLSKVKVNQVYNFSIVEGGGAGSGSSGGTGIVIISYANATQRGLGGTVTSYTSGSDTYWVHRYTTSSTYLA